MKKNKKLFKRIAALCLSAILLAPSIKVSASEDLLLMSLDTLDNDVSCKHELTSLTYDAGYNKTTCMNCGEILASEYVGDKTSVSCTHNSTHRNIIQSATCTESGSYEDVCDNDSCKAVVGTGTITPTEHDWIILDYKEPTCSDAGYEIKICSLCGADDSAVLEQVEHNITGESSVVIEAYNKVTKTKCVNCGAWFVTNIEELSHEHNYVEKNKQDATCTENGYVEYVCDGDESELSCDQKTKIEQIAKKGHSYIDEVVDATCENSGYTIHRCKECDYNFIDNEVAALGHDYNEDDIMSAEVVVEPGCTTDGMLKYTCIRCPKTKTETILPTGHTEVLKYTISATCTTPGKEIYGCDYCDDLYIEKALPIASHVWIHTIIASPSCIEEGLEADICSVCGETINEDPISELGHNYNKTETRMATCESPSTETYKCSNCRSTYYTHVTPALGHSYGEWTVTAPVTCISAGIETRTCSCGHSEDRIVDALEHSYEWVITTPATYSTQGIESHKCTMCGRVDDTKKIPVISHTHSWGTSVMVVNPTCQAKGMSSRTCTICDVTENYETEKSGHVYNEATIDYDSTCTSKGQISQKCKWCGIRDEASLEEIETKQHEYSNDYVIDVNATCSNIGYKSKHCKNCAAKTDIQTIEKTDHKLVEVSRIAPTCEDNGIIHLSCENCAYSEEDMITLGALGHNYDTEYTIDREATCVVTGSKSRHCLNDSCLASTEKTVIPVSEHLYEVSSIIPATCTSEGNVVYTCSVCNDSYNEGLASLGHNYSAVVVKPTCNENGYTIHTCSECGDSYSDSEVLKLGHDFNEDELDAGTVDKEPTCTEKGILTYTCIRCGETKSIQVTETGHSPKLNAVIENMVEATCVAEGTYDEVVYCETCHAELSREAKIEQINELNHNYDVECTSTCTLEGIKTYTCRNAGCEYTYSENTAAVGHRYSEGMCINCGEIDSNYKPNQNTNKKEDLYKAEIPVNEDVIVEESVIVESTAFENNSDNDIQLIDNEDLVTDESKMYEDNIGDNYLDENTDIQNSETDNVKDTVVDNKNILSKENLVEAAKNGKDIIWEMDNGTWIIDASSITNVEDIDLSIRFADDIIPLTVINSLVSDYSIIQFEIAHDGPFGFNAELNLLVDGKYANKQASLYCYNGETMEYIQSAEVSKDGLLSFDFSHASVYAITFIDAEEVVEKSDSNEIVITRTQDSYGDTEVTEAINDDEKKLMLPTVIGITLIISFSIIIAMLKRNRRRRI